jgi:hypothetical protein
MAGDSAAAAGVAADFCRVPADLRVEHRLTHLRVLVVAAAAEEAAAVAVSLAPDLVPRSRT